MEETRTVTAITRMREKDKKGAVDLLSFYAAKLLRRDSNSIPLGAFIGSKFYVNTVTLDLMLTYSPDELKQVPNIRPPKFRLLRQHSFHIDDSMEDFVFRRECIYQVPRGKKL